VPWLRGWRAWTLGGGLGAALGVLFVIDYASGRALYGAFASCHAYPEFPVLLAMLLSFGCSGFTAGFQGNRIQAPGTGVSLNVTREGNSDVIWSES
jgi:hypothetical protein